MQPRSSHLLYIHCIYTLYIYIHTYIYYIYKTHIHTLEDIQPTWSYVVDFSAWLILEYTLHTQLPQTSPNCRKVNGKYSPASSRKTSRINAAASLSSAPMISGATSNTVTWHHELQGLNQNLWRVSLFIRASLGLLGLVGWSSLDYNQYHGIFRIFFLCEPWKRLGFWSHAKNHASGFLKSQLSHFGKSRVNPQLLSWGMVLPLMKMAILLGSLRIPIYGSIVGIRDSLFLGFTHYFGSKWAIWETQGSRTGTAINLGRPHRLQHVCRKMTYGNFGGYCLSANDVCAQVRHNLQRGYRYLERSHRLPSIKSMQFMKTNVSPWYVSNWVFEVTQVVFQTPKRWKSWPLKNIPFRAW